MMIGLCIGICVLFLLYVVRLARLAAKPAFAVRGILSGEKLGYMMASLAFGAKKTTRGNGLDMRGIRRNLLYAQKNIAKRIASGKQVQPCEQNFYDAFYRIDEVLSHIATCKRTFGKLPHVHGVPRLYSLCELLVKSTGGVINRDNVCAAVRTYCAETPLTFAELQSLGDMLQVALCEYLAMYASKMTHMAQLVQKGETDATAGRTSHTDLRYNSYVYGRFCQSADIPVGDFSDIDLREKMRQFSVGSAGYNARVVAAVGSLHTLAAFMTDAFVLTLSPVYEILLSADPTFGMLSDATKNLYLWEIYLQSRRRRLNEKSIASEILFKAAKENKDIAYFILPKPAGKKGQLVWIVVTLAIATITGMLAVFLFPRLGWAYSLLAGPIWTFVADFSVRTTMRYALRRRSLPAYDTKTLHASSHATTIVLPEFVGTVADIDASFAHLSTVMAANPSSLFSYCLLLDYPKSQAQVDENDAAFTKRITDKFASLGATANRVCVLVRKRTAVAGESYWQGYEKKRGALIDFNKFVLTGSGEFAVQLGSLPRVKYAVTLDADTLLCDCLELVAIKAHPYCKDAAILSMSCKTTQKNTLYAKLYSGEVGPGRYRAGQSALLFDAFGLGNYTGKGIYDVAQFDARLSEFFPDNAILSHDFIEGAVGGCYDTTVNASEDFPQTFSDSFARDLRWLRGDWQLLPYTWVRVRNKRGKRIRNPLSPAASFSLGLRLTLSLLPLSQLAVLLFSLFGGLSVAVVIVVALPQLLRMVFALRSLPHAARQTAFEWMRCILELLVLPTVAVYTLCAVIVTLYRLVTRRKLLEWNVFAHTKGNISMLPNAIAAILFAATAAVFSLSYGFYIIAALFILGTFPMRLLGRSRVQTERSDALLAMLTQTAKQTFAYFAAQEELYRLPCDCYQEDNGKGWCARTSPTNIGMALTAYVSAYEIGLIDKERLFRYAEKIIEAVEECEKYKGNLYNWYDCKTLQVLPKRFVSSVDSGNFLVALSLLSTYLEGDLLVRVNVLIQETQLDALYDSERKLLYIGYDDELKTTTSNHYDLLGSESTLTYLMACGYGKIPHEAFYNLDRHAVRSGRSITVYSWTGGMFEYLMSRLFISPDSTTVLGQSMEGAVKAHIAYAKNRNSEIWGISECRYNAYDDGGGNLYRAFGVPHIAHSHVPENPPYAAYASFLALPYCSDNKFLQAVNAYQTVGGTGDYGFYESVDGEIPVRSYMTHHQGMIMAACANAIKRDCLPSRLQSLPQWRTAKLLCGEERVTKARKKRRFAVGAPLREIAQSDVYLSKCGGCTVVADSKNVAVRYHGKQVFRNLCVYADGVNLLQGEYGAGATAWWHSQSDEYKADAELMLLPSPLAVAVAVRYRNVSSRPVTVKFKVGASPVLAAAEDYEAHPVYSQMFIETGNGGQYVWARRKGDGVTLLHCIQHNGDVVYGEDACTFYGRGRGASGAQNMLPMPNSAFSVTLQTGEVHTFTAYFLTVDTVEKAEQAVRLVLSPDCIARYQGAIGQLATEYTPDVRTMAKRLLQQQYGAIAVERAGLDKPTIVHEIPLSTQQLRAYLDELRQLYALGFSFHAVLYCRNRRNEYPVAYFDAEREVAQSGIRGDAGNLGKVVVVQCDENLYARLKAHVPVAQKSECRMYYCPQSSVQTKEQIMLAQSQLPSVVTEQGMGGFTAENGYLTDITDADTPSPWCNIIADGQMGCILTESGGGYTFGTNSRQHKLTAWSNDPVKDTPSEFVAIVDGETVYSVTKRPLTAPAVYTAEHARGYTEYRCTYNALASVMRVGIARDENRKVYELTLKNNGDTDKTLQCMYLMCPVLGDFRRNTLPSMTVTPIQNGLHLRCESSGVEAYVYADIAAHGVSANIQDGKLTVYEVPHKAQTYSGVAVQVVLGAKQTKVIRFVLSCESPEPFDEQNEMWLRARNYYDKLCKITFDGEYGYLTQWLPYQIYNSRFVGRTGFYQVSGAYGFRDQLQDCLALLYCDPQLVRKHILECARHQFKEGDVQHWWHPPAIGVRTHVCDDRLWLVYVTCAYISQTGDTAILQESVPYLRDVPISPQDASVYTSAEISTRRASLYEHCVRAIEIACDFGQNGLVRMRGGDWNDAMDKVGSKGDGVSVWCSMFLYHVIDRFMPHVKDIDLCDRLRDVLQHLYDAVCNAYEGDRFLRAVADDGSVLGSKSSQACKIDILTQSWSVLAGIGSSVQKQTALNAAYHILCDKDRKIIQLFDPPFTSPDGVGYIGNYPPYVRENGGQYTQAAVWYVMALFHSGQSERANELLQWLSPAHRTRSVAQVRTYCVEPYVTAADVYGGDLVGKGGWTWYTGSAAWLYKCLIEEYAGITIRGDIVQFNPHLPADTHKLHVVIQWENKPIEIDIVNSGQGQWRVRIGEVIYNSASLKLTKGLVGKQIAVIRLPNR